MELDELHIHNAATVLVGNSQTVTYGCLRIGGSCIYRRYVIKLTKRFDKWNSLDVHEFEEKECIDVFLQECIMHG